MIVCTMYIVQYCNCNFFMCWPFCCWSYTNCNLPWVERLEVEAGEEAGGEEGAAAASLHEQQDREEEEEATEDVDESSRYSSAVMDN